MKKIISLLSAAAMLSAVSVTAFAREITESKGSRKADVTISTSVAPAYTVSIPLNANVAFNAAQTNFGSVSLDAARLAPNKAVEITITSDFDLNNSTDKTAVIPYTLKATKGTDEEVVAAGYSAKLQNTGDKVDLTINITQADWDAAAAGDYSDTVTFNIAYVDAV